MDQTAKILLVDQDKTFRDALCDTLSGAGYTIQVAEGPEQAASIIDADPPDLLVVVQEVISVKAGTLADRAAERKLPVIVLNGSRDAKTDSHPLMISANAVLSRPFRRRQILDTVHRVLSARGTTHPLTARALTTSQKKGG